MEDGYHLNIARHEPTSSAPYTHYARVFLGRCSQWEAMHKAQFIMKAMSAVDPHIHDWRFGLSHWQATGVSIDLNEEKKDG